MTFLDLLWIFFILSSLQPVVRKQVLQWQRMKALRQIEQRRGSRFIGMIHRQQTMSLLGFPIIRSIEIQDFEAVLRAIQLTDRSVPIDLVLHTPGGLVLAAGTWTHDYPITVDEARWLGLLVSIDMPSEVLELKQLYPQAAQNRPSVEYIPLPYGPREGETKRAAPASGSRRA